jgi:AcrR family transcriptional regulator
MARPRSDIGPRLLHAARARFLRDGVDGASLREIARAARTSLGMIHYYFPTKDDFFLAVVEEIYAGFSADLTRIMGKLEPFEVKVRALYARIAEGTDAELDVLRLVVREVLVSSSRRHLIMQRFLRGHILPIIGGIIEAQRTGEIDAHHPVPAVAMGMLSTALFPQLAYRVMGELRGALPVELPPATDLASALVKIFLGGARAAAAPPSTSETPARGRGRRDVAARAARARRAGE